MQKIAIIGAGRMACIIAIRAKEINIETHCFAWNKNAFAKKYVDYFYNISIYEKNEIYTMCKKIGIDGVVASTGKAIYTTSYIANKLKLNGNPLNVAQNIRDKYRNRTLIRNINNLKQPEFFLIKTIEEIKKLHIKYPIILKPKSEGGKKGIIVVKDESDLENAFKYTLCSVDYRNDNKEIIVEEYISYGKEYSVESLSFHGKNYIIQITEKESSGPPHCVELGHHQPANISIEMRYKIEKIIGEALSCIGIVNGPCHTEIKIVDDEIYLIEFNARPGGDHIAYPLTELSTGYPYITGIIKVALDELEPINIKEFKHNYAGVCFLTKQTEYLKPIFNHCLEYDWCFEKNEVSKEIKTLINNDGYNINYFIYYSKNKRPDFKILL